MPLTARQADFVQQYLVDLNIAQAWIRAGGAPASAKQDGHRAFKTEKVQAAIVEAMTNRAKRTEITADRVLRELAKIGFADAADVMDWGTKEVAFGYDADGKKLPAEDISDAVVVQVFDAPFVKPINRDDLPPDIRAAVAEVALTKDGFKIKMHDKVGALREMGRHVGIADNVNLRTPDGMVVMVKEFTAKPSAVD